MPKRMPEYFTLPPARCWRNDNTILFNMGNVLLAWNVLIVSDRLSCSRWPPSGNDRTRLAQAVVSRVVQSYRERHQGPVFRRAGEIFGRITLGSFSSLVTDYDDDTQVLLGQRPDNSRVGVAGMSQGARDQLFLALRIAAIEEHLKQREAIPLVIDDLLVQFDDHVRRPRYRCWLILPDILRCCSSRTTGICVNLLHLYFRWALGNGTIWAQPASEASCAHALLATAATIFKITLRLPPTLPPQLPSDR